jgi:Flp pilus assembly protein TadG
MRARQQQLDGEQGAILVHVALAIIALMAFSTFVVDYGVFWLGRRQSQNAADAGALAGAIALAYDDYSDRTVDGPAQDNAVSAALANTVFGAPPSVVAGTDVTFPPCPDDGTDGCIRVDVYRTVDRGNPLPIMAGTFVGLVNQDVRATATAKVSTANATDCLKPWGVIDRWQENQDPGGWGPESTFDKYDKKGELDPSINPADVYIAPTDGDPGTGFYPFESDGSRSPYYGMPFSLKVGDQQNFDYATGWFAALALFGDTGGADYKDNIVNCVGTTYTIGQELDIDTEPGQKVGPTSQGVGELVAKDPNAIWNTTTNSVTGSAFAASPRIVAIPLINPDLMAEAQKGGRTSVPLTNILGFFVEGWDQSEKAVYGRLVTVPGFKVGNTNPVGTASFAMEITLIR